MISEGGTVTGTGQVIRADGTVIDVILTSDPLTKEQAQQINEGIEHGNNTR
jgi:hypothetical protein